MPAYGPFTSMVRTTTRPGTTLYGYNWWMARKWFRQKPVTSAPNPYEFDEARLIYHSADSVPTNMSGLALTYCQSDRLAHAQAYGNFVDQKGAAAELAVSLLETKQAGQMLDKRLTQMANFALAVKRGRWPDAARHLGLKATDRRLQKGRPPGVKRGAKHFASNVLEYNFGWAPLAMDISSAIEVIQRKSPSPIIKGRGYATFRSKVPHSYVVPKKDGGEVQESTGVLIQARLEISNPNLFLANQLGFINAGSILWERVPFSFVVDWFSNVGQVIASFTDFYGCDLRDSMTTYFRKRTQSNFFGNYPSRAQKYEQTSVRRLVIISGPSLVIKPFRGLSAQRGANAVSLLLQRLKT